MRTTNSDDSNITQSNPLHEAIQRGDFTEIKFWIESGENINDLNEQGLTILSALFNDQAVFSSLVTGEELQIYNNGNEDGYIYVGDGCYSSIVDEKDGFLDVVTMMLEYGVDPNLADADGRTPLHWAAYFGFNEVVFALLDAGADPTAQDMNGETPRDLAHEKNYSQIGERLLTQERYLAVCHRLNTIDALGFPSPLDVSISGFLSMKDLTFFSSVAKPETIQRFLQDKLFSN